MTGLHRFVVFYHLEAHWLGSIYHLTWFTTSPVGHTSFRSYRARVIDYVSAVVPSMWLPHNYSLMARKKSWKVERSQWRSSGLRAPYKGSALRMTLYSMNFDRSMTVSFVLYIFEHQLKAFPGSFEEIDLVVERWEWHRIAIYTLRSTIFLSLIVSLMLVKKQCKKTTPCRRWTEL